MAPADRGVRGAPDALERERGDDARHLVLGEPEVAEQHEVARAEFRDRITATVDVRVEDVSDYELTFADLGSWPPRG